MFSEAQIVSYTL